ncbi:MAG: pyridoxal-phosphate dependent enzyme, partial [Calditrichia bacterium]|nr:pyridoxal-phosphate dependent enzyme [Calditrichia bacterium]
MSHYFYKCFDCKEEYKPDIIEDNFHYLCPKCGKAEKNKPLKGVLLIEYDYKYISSKISMAKFLSFEPGSFWQYPYLWPLNYKNQHDKYLLSGISHDMLDRLSLQSNPVQTYNYKGQKIFLMDESRNPTLSYKDRASNLVALKALQLGINEIAAASTGNAGSSLAGICARLGIKSHLFVPQNIPDAKRIQIQSFGANVYIVDGDYDTAFDLSLEVSQKMKWYNRNTAFNPLTIEGKKSGAYDMFL